MRNSRRFIPVFLLSLVLVFNLCTTTVLSSERQTTYDQAATNIISAHKSVNPSINRTSYTLVKSQTTTLKIKNAKGTVSWSSSNTKVATVNKSGKVYAKRNGKATITAKIKNKKLKCVIKVETPKIKYTSLKLTKGYKKTLWLSGNTQKITWYSSNKSIATVSSKGLVTAKKAGTTTITAKLTSGKTYKCRITIKNPSIGNIVYITKTGQCYHKSGCKCLRRSKIAISLKNAKARGYRPCHICCK